MPKPTIDTATARAALVKARDGLVTDRTDALADALAALLIAIEAAK